MRCCASLSPVPANATPALATQSPSPARVAESTLQALLFSQILKPLAKDLGPVGEVAVESVVQRMFGPVRS